MVKEIDWEHKRDEWIHLVHTLLEEIKIWRRQEWRIEESLRTVTEEHIGAYRIQCLVITTRTAQIHIDPIGRNIIGATGRVDILSYPSMDRLLLLRQGNAWKLYTESKIPWPQEWKKETFLSVVEALAKSK